MYIRIHILKYLNGHKVKKPIYVWLTIFSPVCFWPCNPFLGATLMNTLQLTLSLSQSYPIALALVVQVSSGPALAFLLQRIFFLIPCKLPWQKALPACFAGKKCWELTPQTLKQCLTRGGAQILHVPHILRVVFYTDFQSHPWEINPRSPPTVAGLSS